MTMLLEVALHDFLSSQTEITNVVDNRIYPIWKPQDDARPSITYNNVYTNHHASLYGGSGLQEARIEIHCWGTYKEAKEISEIVRKKMQGYKGLWGDRTIQGCTYEESVDYDPDEYMAKVGLYAVTMDFVVWTDESQEIYND